MRKAAQGFSLLELAVVSVVLSILLALFLQQLTYYQGAAERAQFQATLRIYKTALQIRLAELMLARRESEASLLEAEDPTRWLAQRPGNYGGEYPAQPRRGSWYFDTDAKELVYVVNFDDGLVVEGQHVAGQLRFRVKVIFQPAGAGARAIGGVNLEPTAGYRWP